MKREIKFRAWNKKDKVMVDVAAMNFGPSGFWSLIEDAYDAELQLADSYELMQYTGLKDKNGREIYEGDVLDIGLRNQDGKPIIAPVSYETYAAGYVLDNGGNGIWQRLTKECEVIGNTFENPELLEGKQ
ncbi:YopX family protein [Lacticaseibacillus rhamnosus]|uniref:YopX family protein n=1 Tax=Lacticaseibacillus rhamnosus TaxID=47715 RepID=UPI00237F81A8|nr:YopX family protein [Lacticaseibacillus rhamnosus]MDE3295885.1 YopX family protein [Lacticaseibacillus rhamnosus]